MAGNQVRIGVGVGGVGKASSDLDKLRDKFDKLQKGGVKGFGIGIGAGIAVAGFSLIDRAAATTISFIGDSIEKASALNETLSKSSVVFGSSAKSVEVWGGTLAKSFAISKQAGIEAAASFGNVFQNMGFTEDAAVKMSERFVELAGDLASFNNISTDEALVKLRSGLAGEAEPLRTMGVFLTEAKVKAKAMQLGLADANGEVSESAKVTARYKLILEQTGSAQGDFARTSDGLANSQRRLSAEWDDASAKLGQKLLPFVTRAVSDFADLLGATEDLGNSDAPNQFTDSWITGIGDIIKAGQAVPWPIGHKGEPDWNHLFDGPPKAAEKAGRDMKRVFESNPLKTTMTAFYKPVWHEFDVAAFKAQNEAREFPGKIAQGIRDGLPDIDSALADLHADLEHKPFPHAHLLGELWSKDLQKGLRSQNKYIRAEAEQIRLNILKQLAANYFFTGGVNAGRSFTRGLARSTSGNTNPNIRAEGGPVTGGTPYLVGEKGMELFVPKGSGDIIPNDRLKTTGGTALGGSMIFNVTVNAAPGMSPAQAKAIGNAITPAIADNLYRRGLIPRMT